MAVINVLDHQTIDKIAAGEVVERPFSVVKELVENAIDAGADAITVEIKDGGTSLIRVTDNGSGIEKSQVRNAFLRHATSKITSADDLTELVSLGFRGEALASIAAVSMVELISKMPEDLTGIRYMIEGGTEKEWEEIGAPEGTTILVRNLFYNTPPRRKFLKQPQTEGSYVADLMEHLALSNPKVSFKFIVNGQTRFYTTGNGELREIIYRIYGREITAELLPFAWQGEGMSVSGFLGKPAINRANRNYEIFYINGRYIRSTLISKAIEEGYREYLMQHKFPFCVLHFQMDTRRIDVNVHPTKMEVRIADSQAFYETVKQAIYDALHGREMIPEVKLTEREEKQETVEKGKRKECIPEPFERTRIAQITRSAKPLAVPEGTASHRYENRQKNVQRIENTVSQADTYDRDLAVNIQPQKLVRAPEEYQQAFTGTEEAGMPFRQAAVQMELFEDKVLSEQARKQFELIGQVFHTYWLISYQDKLLIIDQHAAHEKVKFERFRKQFQEHEVVSQMMNPPMVVTLTGKEQECYLRHAADFEALGFIIEEFGGNDYTIRGVPMDLYGYGEKVFFQEILDELVGEAANGTPEAIQTRIATMACKAAVKGNKGMSREEAEQLIDELLTLENPYTCPHGRPTIISMSKYELEKKFKRVVN